MPVFEGIACDLCASSTSLAETTIKALKIVERRASRAGTAAVVFSVFALDAGRWTFLPWTLDERFQIQRL